MAKYEHRISGNFDHFLTEMTHTILGGSISAITSGGSQALFFKINTFGESAFLNKFIDFVERYESAF